MVFASTISPGILLVYFFNNSLIFSLDIFKLILLSFSITIPVLVLNLFLSLSFITNKDTIELNDEDRFSLNFIAGSLITLIELDLGILITYLLHNPIRYFVINFIVIQLGLVFLAAVRVRRHQADQENDEDGQHSGYALGKILKAPSKPLKAS